MSVSLSGCMHTTFMQVPSQFRIDQSDPLELLELQVVMNHVLDVGTGN